MGLDPLTKNAVLKAIPGLRAFALALCRDRDRADDLVQETLLRALTSIDSFRPGTNMSAWLVTILRNHFRSECRKLWRNVEDVDGRWAESLKSAADQDDAMGFDDLCEALDELPIAQREAIVLVAGSGYSYEETARICECPVGTIRSRLNRARARLAELLSIDGLEDLGPDPKTRAVLYGAQPAAALAH